MSTREVACLAGGILTGILIKVAIWKFQCWKIHKAVRFMTMVSTLIDIELYDYEEDYEDDEDARYDDETGDGEEGTEAKS